MNTASTQHPVVRMAAHPLVKRNVLTRLIAALNREPRAESREPRAESREPRAESREPRAESREPRAESREPRAESREPRAESREPRAESREFCPRRGSPPRPSPPSRANLLRSDADLPAASAPAASACPSPGARGAGRAVFRLSTAPRGARPEPHPRQHRGFLSRLGTRLRRAGQSSRAPRTPFRSAATVLALLTTLTLSLGFIPSAGAQTFTCGALDLGGRNEIWSATLTVEHVEVEISGFTRRLWDGYDEDDGGELSDTSFEIGFNDMDRTQTLL